MVLQLQVWDRDVTTPHRVLPSGSLGLDWGTSYVQKCIQSFAGEIGKIETTWKALARWEDNIKVYLKK
jgi:hypothetical protein